jgi:phosphatidylserine/phosphatidylglycerophosphate/cardiolipin synthase-like enzyme
MKKVIMNSLSSSKLYDNETFYKAFKKVLENTHRSVLIESPFIATRRMDNLFPVLRRLRQQGVHIVVNTRKPEENDNGYGLQTIYAIQAMQQMGILVLYTVKHHRKLAIIDSEILWEGSLNILSQNDSCEIMRRIEPEELARQMIQFVGLDRFV